MSPVRKGTWGALLVGAFVLAFLGPTSVPHVPEEEKSAAVYSTAILIIGDGCFPQEIAEPNSGIALVLKSTGHTSPCWSRFLETEMEVWKAS